MQSSKEQQGETRKSSKVNSAKKQRKTIEWEDYYRDFFKKIRDSKGKFHAKMVTKKDRNGIGLIRC